MDLLPVSMEAFLQCGGWQDRNGDGQPAFVHKMGTSQRLVVEVDSMEQFSLLLEELMIRVASVSATQLY